MSDVEKRFDAMSRIKREESEKLKQAISESEADESFNNDLEAVSLETETGFVEIRKGDTFKWRSGVDNPLFKVARIERINKYKTYFYFRTQMEDGTWEAENGSGRIESKNIIQYLSGAQKM
jgi:hypothetical protein